MRSVFRGYASRGMGHTMNKINEFGNETACANCGDEWAALDENNLCRECREIWDGE
jgi:hypothetical protein